MSLKKIGEALHITNDGKIVARLAVVPPLGIQVFDYGMKRVGSLYDIIGPVKAPYGLIKTNQNDASFIIGKSIYVDARSLEKQNRKLVKGEKRRGRHYGRSRRI
ncbi:MAG: H/ACA ribonucleoprotein complex subunit GAR1 [Thermocladium sp.]